MNLRRFYGERETRRVLAASEHLREVRNRHGIATQRMFAEEGLGTFGVGGVSLTAPAIAGQLALLAQALEERGEQLESVLIIGGPAIIPFDLAPNPTPQDGDANVPSDLLYGGLATGALMPEWPVGRLPGAEGAARSAELLERLIQQAARMHMLQPPVQFTKAFGYSTAVWQATSSQVYAEVSPQPLLLSPPTVAATLDRALLDGADAVYCNLHGVLGGAAWYGQATGNSSYLLALRPEDVLAVNFAGAIVVSEACYGAVIAGRDEQTSLALAFLSRGAAGFIGATAMSYGPAFTPVGEADLLALHFWRALRQGSTSIGAALLEARAQMLLDTLAHQPMLDADDRKTMLEFVLYGDPTLWRGARV